MEFYKTAVCSKISFQNESYRNEFKAILADKQVDDERCNGLGGQPRTAVPYGEISHVESQEVSCFAFEIE